MQGVTRKIHIYILAIVRFLPLRGQNRLDKTCEGIYYLFIYLFIIYYELYQLPSRTVE